MIAKRILVPTDYSAGSKLALKLAVALASGGEDKSVIVLHIVEPAVPSYDSELGVLEPEALRTELEALHASREQEVRIDAEIRYGVPADQILDYAQSHSVDLIVMGTHGRNSIMDMLVGTTAEIVMRNATCPVLSVRHDSVMPSDTKAIDVT